VEIQGRHHEGDRCLRSAGTDHFFFLQLRY
jgi:hypothetical protein